MALGDYVKTTFVNGTSPAINATNLNNNENKTKELDTETGTHIANKASASVLGHVKVGDSLNIDANGILSAAVKTPFTIYVNGTSGNDSNTGLSSGAAVATIGRAVAIAKLSICNYITISITAETYAENVLLDGLACSHLKITKEGAGTVQINGGIDWSNGQSLNITSLSVSGNNITVSNLTHFEAVGVTVSSGSVSSIHADTVAVMRIVNCTLTNDAGAGVAPIDVTRIGSIYCNGNSITGDGCIAAYNVGSLQLYGEAWTVLAGSTYGLLIAYGTICYMENVSGALGTVPVCRVLGSILCRGSNSVTGAADVTSSGGQIFT